MGTGEAAALLTALFWAIGIFPFTQAAKRMGSMAVNNFRLLVATVLFSVVLMIWVDPQPFEWFSKPGLESWVWMSLSGLVGLTIGDYFSFASFALLGPRLSSVFSTLAPGAALFFAWALLGESVSPVALLGMLITLLGVWMVVLSKGEAVPEKPEGKQLARGIGYAVAAALCQGVGLVFSRVGLRPMDGGSPISSWFPPHTAQLDAITPVHAAWMRMFSATLMAYLFVVFSGRLRSTSLPILTNQGKGLPYLFAGTAFGPVLGMITSMWAISLIPAPIAQTIFSLVPVLVMVLGAVFFKLPLKRNLIAGCVIAILGVLVLIWRQQIIDYCLWMFA